MRILGFGASTMQGVGDSSGGFFARLGGMPSPAIDVQWFNHGIGGNTTRDMLARTDRAVGVNATAVVVLLGCNDLPRDRDNAPGRRVALAEYGQNVGAILRAIRAPRSLFVTSFAVCERRTGVAPATFDEYMAAATSAARANGYDAWDLHGETRASVERYWAADGLHFNDAGHALIAAGVHKRLFGG